MEFENVNNFNIALEAAAKKKSASRFARSLAHLLKKILRRAKPVCCAVPAQPTSQEEMDNAANEALEHKLFSFEFDAAPERDLRPFNYITEYQVATRQSC
ncbi:Hypothetical protein NTJ_04824 [Nesidiocoris tenuis]|uniref:Uncharacterized protein n=1 Tax=Nesidiocoris tenuis TaxID=355587 RepID=A0ABN7AID1_9HEMI|nr:Hypothetical protein NTJ_04824 [Nesidiocoris tenuis]